MQNIVSFIGLFCKETYNLKEPAIRSHPISQTARKPFWIPAGVNLFHSKPADINPGSLKWVKITKYLRSKLGVDTIGRLFTFIGFFCNRALQKRLYSAKEIYNFKELGSLQLQVSFTKEPYKRDYSAKESSNFKEPTNRSHPIMVHMKQQRVYGVENPHPRSFLGGVSKGILHFMLCN